MNYISNTPEDISSMLKDISASKNTALSSIDDLFSDIPGNLRIKSLNLPGSLSEIEICEKMKSHAEKNLSYAGYKSFMGGGSYEHFIPSAVGAVIGRSDFYTAYTPYQPEVSQGTLMSIFEYQTMICNLTGMQASNASHYDGATALAESMIMAYNINSRKEFMVAETINPMHMSVLETYAHAAGFKLHVIPYEGKSGKLDADFIKSHMNDSISAVLVQNPSFIGVVEDLKWLADMAHANGAVLAVSANPISLGLLKPPAEYGADIVCGDGQPLGIPSSFGGPALGFMATSQKYVRKLPGRIVGETVDKNGKRAFVLTLQAREQHIRREKASSNICSNQALCALAATVYLSYLGPYGLNKVAARCSDMAHYLAGEIAKVKGFELKFEGSHFFHEFVITYPKTLTYEKLFDHFASHKILAGVDLSKFFISEHNCLLVCATEMRTKADIDAYIKCLEAIKW
ncbi:MAG TPA: aminomethyl-transferring glycine dehydrogenase subunit GcvPA [Candidatus Wallbacteria bacterium]|nr:aminomethyl-transferring glycine dehydrogenase subunit GcvPA [Candidatus Wallbacteria bacterium]